MQNIFVIFMILECPLMMQKKIQSNTQIKFLSSTKIIKTISEHF